MLVVKGKYIDFCDPDDTMKPNMLGVYQCVEEQKIDIVICGFETVPDGQTNIRGEHTKSENVARRIDLFKPKNTCKK